ncbi:MAG: hypothetical protein KBD26_02215 [Candidatus Pacebacteria bacterium]|nr:hypothetical protein [Candidatus Paceibacterota bacterium]MBP9772627.1 hypothetical protein [Candidatus Paceibacterota bacterium]
MKNKLAIGALALAVLFTSSSALAAKPEGLTSFKGRLDSLVVRMDGILDRFEAVMVKAEAKGYDTSNAEDAYDAVIAKQDAAKAEVEALKTLIDETIAGGVVTPTAEIRTQTKETKDALMAYRDSVKELRDELREAIENKKGEAEDAPADEPAL